MAMLATGYAKIYRCKISLGWPRNADPHLILHLKADFRAYHERLGGMGMKLSTVWDVPKKKRTCFFTVGCHVKWDYHNNGDVDDVGVLESSLPERSERKATPAQISEQFGAPRPLPLMTRQQHKQHGSKSGY